MQLKVVYKYDKLLYMVYSVLCRKRYGKYSLDFERIRGAAYTCTDTSI